MAEDNDNTNASDGLGGLLVLGLLGYAAYKFIKSGISEGNATSSKKRLSPFEIESFVNTEFRHLDDDEIALSCVCLFIPDFIGFKKEHYDNMLLSRIKNIDRHINSMINLGYEAFNQQLNEEQLKDLLSFIRKDCYQEIKDIKFIAKMKGNLMSFIPGMKFFGNAKNANIDYKVITAIKRGLIEYFTELYVNGRTIEEAKEFFKLKYVYVFRNSLG